MRIAPRALAAFHGGALLCAAVFASCGESDGTPPRAPAPRAQVARNDSIPPDGVALLILGTAQDAGAPQIACRRACCERLRARGERVWVASAALIDARERRTFLLDATPDLRDQLDHPALRPYVHDGRRPVDGLLLTHAHAGHYLGLAYFGRESLAADDLAIYATPRMKRFLESSGPWNLLLRAGHAHVEELPAASRLELSASLAIEPFAVPHRDEYSDSVGFRIAGPRRTAIYLPDVDAIDEALWRRLLDCDVLLLDGTFWADGELVGRDMSDVPHPRMRETLERWSAVDPAARPELWFIHLNHTNPALDPDSAEARAVREAGARIARAGDVLVL